MKLKVCVYVPTVLAERLFAFVRSRALADRWAGRPITSQSSTVCAALTAFLDAQAQGNQPKP